MGGTVVVLSQPQGVREQKGLWETLPYCFDETFLRCVLIPAVRVVQSTCPPLQYACDSSGINVQIFRTFYIGQW